MPQDRPGSMRTTTIPDQPWITNINSLFAENKLRDLISNSTNEYRYCSLCYDGSTPLYANISVGSNLTCSTLDSGLKKFMLSTSPTCQTAQDYYAKTCGCPIAPRCPGLCFGGARPFFDRTFPISLNNEGTFTSCIMADTIMKNTSENSIYCQLSDYLSEYCGCNPFVRSACTTCYGNDAIPNLNETFVYGTNPESTLKTCATMVLEDILADYSGIKIYSGDCDVRQFFGAIKCNCPRLPPKLNHGCQLCSTGQDLSVSTVIHAFNISMKCSELNVYLNVDSSCTAKYYLNASVFDACCIGKSSSVSSRNRLSSIVCALLLITTWILL